MKLSTLLHLLLKIVCMKSFVLARYFDMPPLPKTQSVIASITINRNAWLSLATKGFHSRPFHAGLCSVDEEVIILKQTQIPPERLLILNLLIFFKRPSHSCPWKMQGGYSLWQDRDSNLLQVGLPPLLSTCQARPGLRERQPELLIKR